MRSAPMPAMLPAILVAMMLTACARPAAAPQDTSSASATAAAAAATVTPAKAPTAPPATARKVAEANDLYDFAYAYPAQAAAIADLKAWLDKDLAKQKAALIADASEGRKDAKQNDYPFHAYEGSTTWQVVTDLPGWLSLSAAIDSYTGGAHPNHWFGALLWDKAANARRAAVDLFTSQAALKAAIARPFCAALDRARKERRGGEDWGGDGIDEFTRCIDPLEQVVILGSKGGKGFDRIGFLIAPYNAGPYAEGDYEVTLPVTPALLATVKPEYRSAFALP